MILLYDVPTNFQKNNKAKPQIKHAVLAIDNHFSEKEKVVISNDQLNTVFSEAIKILKAKLPMGQQRNLLFLIWTK